jgi:hypothetical protein
MAEPDPAARIAAVRQYVLTARTAIASAADAVSGALASALGWLPAPTIAAVSGRLTSTNDVQVSNVPGVPDPACRTRCTSPGRGSRTCTRLGHSPAARPGGLAEDLKAGLDEVIALAR